MQLSSLQLEAFAAAARAGNISRAAEQLHLTQSALSQRILNLERELETTLFVREPLQLRLTPAGEELLRYCGIREGLESETLAAIANRREAWGGTIRVGAFSSVTRSLLLPSLTPLLQKHPHVRGELFSREIRELFPMLLRNEVDLILTPFEPERQEIESVWIGDEENVLVRPARGPCRLEVFLDHDAADTTTHEFWAKQKKARPSYRREFLDEVYGLIDGVIAGWGQAILPRHLVETDSRLKIIEGYRPLRIPIHLQHFRQPYYSKLFNTARDLIQGHFRKALS